MHGLGNDFVVIDAINQSVSFTVEQVRFIADRHFGIGCDQLLLVEKADRPEADFLYRIFNADGSEVEQCGNGARCFARFVKEQGLTDKNEIPVQTASGLITLHIESDGQVRVDMGVPVFAPEQIPFTADVAALRYALEVDGSQLEIGAVSMGNPHAVIQVDDIEQAAVTSLGAKIESHARFPQRVNVGFMQLIDRNHIRLRVYERGAGETLACGTGACAAMVVGRQQGLLDDKVVVSLPGGDLIINWSGDNQAVMMTGPAQSVFEGTVRL